VEEVFQLLKLHRFSDVRQTATHTTAEPLVSEPSPFEVAINKLKMYKLQGIDQIPAELIQAGGGMLHSEIHKLDYSSLSKEECLSSARGLLYQVTRMQGKTITCR
jgi:hypothetical protein